ncbi:PIK3C3 [Symbiodinium natans]|uniref:PIK3C3 protein n=1 Tax=Symbiodinium natans TaxID=878477 RepID=A0A812K1X9_9DINO|nr:PIK3C3 [Symbiodinium natans]
MLRCRFLVSVQGASVDHPALLKSKRLGRSSRAAMFKDSVDSQMFAAMLALTTSNYDTMTCWLRAPKLLVAHSRIAMPAELVRRPRRQLSSEEKDLLFRFRWSLTDQPGALTKFLHAVDWSHVEAGTPKPRARS